VKTRALLILLFIADCAGLSGCSDPKQLNFNLEIGAGTQSIVRVVSGVANRDQMTVKNSRSDYGGLAGTQLLFQLDEFDKAISIQSKPMDCENARPCFSQSSYQVSIYAKWPWVSDASLKKLANTVRKEAQVNGAVLKLDREGMQDVSDLTL
jgi:hypothetical protein